MNMSRVKDATAHDQDYVPVHFFTRSPAPTVSCFELFHVVGTTENILLAFCRLGNVRISSFR